MATVTVTEVTEVTGTAVGTGSNQLVRIVAALVLWFAFVLCADRFVNPRRDTAPIAVLACINGRQYTMIHGNNYPLVDEAGQPLFCTY